ncbi:ParA family protein [Actinacidiphila sp. bgisy160]|uniref:ParA family protein n=1 Tax=Actinacidiphila sp. bgisy160 TaxID=3413796 RepID=UPI003D728849
MTQSVPPAGGPKILAVGGLKGGVGKTTTAVHVALEYALQGKKVLLVDADPLSQTAFDWYSTTAKKGAPLPFDLEVWPSPRVGDLVVARAQDYDVVVIDCGGESSDIFGAAAAVAEHVLLVTSPRKAELRRIKGTLAAAVSAVKEVGRLDEVSLNVLLTRVKNSRGAHNDAARDLILNAGLPLLAAEVPDLVEYEDAMETCPASSGHYANIVRELEAA